LLTQGPGRCLPPFAHPAGIVHRDVKPQNCIISGEDKKLKFIDLGAAADLRIGINCGWYSSLHVCTAQP